MNQDIFEKETSFTNSRQCSILLPGQHAPKHNSEEHIAFRLDNDDGFCFATCKVHLDKEIHDGLPDSYARKFYLDNNKLCSLTGTCKNHTRLGFLRNVILGIQLEQFL
jgi:hypothetical protein